MTCPKCGRQMEGYEFWWPYLRPKPDVKGVWYQCDGEGCHSNYFWQDPDGPLEEVVLTAGKDRT